MAESCDWDGKGISDALTIYKNAKDMAHPLLYKCLNKRNNGNGITGILQQPPALIATTSRSIKQQLTQTLVSPGKFNLSNSFDDNKKNECFGSSQPLLYNNTRKIQGQTVTSKYSCRNITFLIIPVIKFCMQLHSFYFLN